MARRVALLAVVLLIGAVLNLALVPGTGPTTVVGDDDSHPANDPCSVDPLSSDCVTVDPDSTNGGTDGGHDDDRLDDIGQQTHNTLQHQLGPERQRRFRQPHPITCPTAEDNPTNVKATGHCMLHLEQM